MDGLKLRSVQQCLQIRAGVAFALSGDVLQRNVVLQLGRQMHVACERQHYCSPISGRWQRAQQLSVKAARSKQSWIDELRSIGGLQCIAAGIERVKPFWGSESGAQRGKRQVK